MTMYSVMPPHWPLVEDVIGVGEDKVSGEEAI
jgi:hypothetical protein